MDKDFEKLNRLIQSAKEFFACPECKELAARAKWYAADFQRRYEDEITRMPTDDTERILYTLEIVERLADMVFNGTGEDRSNAFYDMEDFLNDYLQWAFSDYMDACGLGESLPLCTDDDMGQPADVLEQRLHGLAEELRRYLPDGGNVFRQRSAVTVMWQLLELERAIRYWYCCPPEDFPNLYVIKDK